MAISFFSDYLPMMNYSFSSSVQRPVSDSESSEDPSSEELPLSSSKLLCSGSCNYSSTSTLSWT